MRQYNVGDRVRIIGAPCGMSIDERYKEGVVVSFNAIGSIRINLSYDNTRYLWFPKENIVPFKVIPLPLPG